MNHSPMSSKWSVSVAIVLCVALILVLWSNSVAQSHRSSFIELLKEHTGQSVGVVWRDGNSVPSTLMEVGPDYIVLQTRTGFTQAVPMHAIGSLILKPTIEIQVIR
jgi:hypothetical protein